jgi:prepilin-type N-terminal cleavage/methylation domain-containing protein
MKINTAKTKLRSGFTLIELIIVLVFFGGIAAVGGMILYFIFR